MCECDEKGEQSIWLSSEGCDTFQRPSTLLVWDLLQGCVLGPLVSKGESGNFVGCLVRCASKTLWTHLVMPASSALVHLGTQLCKHACGLVCMLPVISWGVRCHLFSLFVYAIRRVKYFQGAEEKLNDQWSLSVLLFVIVRLIQLFLETLLKDWTHVW